MTMLELNQRQRGVLADKLPDVANVAAGALVFAQFLGERRFSIVLAVAGVALWFLLVAFAIALVGKGKS